MNNNFQSLDIIQLLAFYIQLKNIEWDEDHDKYIHSIVENINTQIQKLHAENDIIMQQNEQILRRLDK